MSITPDHPGVYITEVPSGSRTLTGVATSVTAFVGRALRGPVDTAVPIGSFADFVNAFGPLWRESGLGYAVRDFYLNGGGPAWVVRVVKDAVTAEIAIGDLTLEAHGPGAWANALTAVVSHPDCNGLFTLELRVGDEIETFVDLTVTDGPRRIDTVLAGSRLARVKGAVPAARPEASTAGIPYTVTTEGSDGAAPDADSYVPAGTTRTGLRALEAVDLINILVLPPVAPGGKLPDGVWAAALSVVQERRAFRQRLADFQNTRFKLAQLAADIAAGRAFCDQLIAQHLAGGLDAVGAAAGKLWHSELLGRVTDECLQLFGGYGYMAEYPIARAYADARIERIYAGTSEIMKEIVARDLLDR